MNFVLLTERNSTVRTVCGFRDVTRARAYKKVKAAPAASVKKLQYYSCNSRGATQI